MFLYSSIVRGIIMTVKTTRADTDGIITVDSNKCTGCGLCFSVCTSFSLKIEDNIAKVNESSFIGCIGCGQCVAVCPNDAIMVEGRTLTKEDFVKIPTADSKTNYDQLNSLLFARRSTRFFKDKNIDQEIIDKILQAASTAPMGIPPSEVEVIVLKGKDKVREFSFDCIDCFKKFKWIASPMMLGIMRPFIGKENYDSFKTFISPLLYFFIETKEKDENWLLYDAPLAIYFNSAYTDPADPYIVATYAMLAAESLGLGSCMIGSINPFLKYGCKSLKEKYQINPKTKEGIFVVFGYPKYHYKKAIKRTFGSVKYI